MNYLKLKEKIKRTSAMLLTLLFTMLPSKESLAKLNVMSKELISGAPQVLQGEKVIQTTIETGNFGLHLTFIIFAIICVFTVVYYLRKAVPGKACFGAAALLALIVGGTVVANMFL